MKRNLTGDEAYTTLRAAELPEKTASYTPIAHGNIVKHLKAEIRQSGFMICGEDYKCNAPGPKHPAGQVALGLVRVMFQPDPDLVLCASFLNSYNKKHAFRFVLAGQVALTGNAIILGSDVYGTYRRVHTGNADTLAPGTMSSIIKGAVDYWTALVKFKEDLKLVTVSAHTQHEALASMFLRDNTLNGFQLNAIKEELVKVCDPVLGYQLNAWDFYNVVATAIKDAHPAEWMDVHMRVQTKFDELVLGNSTALSPAPSSTVHFQVTDDDDSHVLVDTLVKSTAESFHTDRIDKGLHSKIFSYEVDASGNTNNWKLLYRHDPTDASLCYSSI